MSSTGARRLSSLLLLAAFLAVPVTALAQEGDPAAGRGPGQDLFYIATPTVAPIRIQYPDDYEPSRSYTLVVGLHGHGGRGDEFLTPAPSFAAAGLIYAVLQAPYALPMAGRIGYSWTLRRVDDDAGDQGEEELSIDYIVKAVDTLTERLNVESVYLMGFSQGGTMTYQTAIRHHERFKGFMVFGSWFRPDWFSDEQIEAANRLRVFVGHDRQDGVVERSTSSRDILEGHGYDVTLYDYEGGHMIAQSALGEMFEWIEAAEGVSSTGR